MSTLRKRQKPIDNDELMDDEEQNQLIKELEATAALHSQSVKRWSAITGASLSALYTFFILHHLLFPWQLSHHALFEQEIKSSSLIIAHIAAIITIFLSSGAVSIADASPSPSSPDAPWQTAFRLSGTLAIFATLFWSVAVYQVYPTLPLNAAWRILWLPAAPVLYVSVMAVLINGIASANPELTRLRAYKYRHKKA